MTKFPGVEIIATDDFNTTWDKATYQDFAQLDIVQYRRYSLNYFDCDKYAVCMKAEAVQVLENCAFGMVQVRTPDGNHELNIFIDSSGLVFYLEPQTGEISSVDLLPSYKPYLIYI